jgi:hypothetical protein
VGWQGTLILNAPLWLGALGMAQALAPGPDRATRWLAAFVLGWAWLTLGMTVLGATGGLRLAPLAGWAGFMGLAGLVAVIWRRPATTPVAVGRGRRDWLVVIAIGLALLPCVVLGATSLLGPVKVVSDGPIYHLYFAARWWKAGRLELVPIPFGENAATYFPAVGDLWFTWLMIGWRGDRLAKVGQAPFLAVAALASYALARRNGASAPSAVLAGSWFVTSTPLLVFSFEPNVDTIFVAGYLAAVYFFQRYIQSEQPRVSLALGALAGGCAWGTKPTGTVFVPPLLALVGLWAILKRRERRAWVVDLAILVALPMVGVAYWFGRNAVLTGNPLYPLDLPWLGWVGWYGSDVMRRGQYALPVGDLASLGDTLLAVLDPRMAPFWLAAVLAGMLYPGRDRNLRVLSALAIANVALYWLLIPYRTQQRFFLQALGLAAVPLARLFDGARWLQVPGLIFLALHLFTSQPWPFARGNNPPPWDMSDLVPNAVPDLVPLSGPQAGAIALLAAGCLLVGLAWERGLRRPGLATAVAALLVPIVLAAGWGGAVASQRGWGSDPFYPPFPDFYRGWLALERASGARGSTVAYAGTNIPYYLMGRGLRNNVRYVNVDGHRNWLLHDYHRQAIQEGRPHWPGYPRPGWDRERPDFDAWLSNLRAEGVNLLVVTRVNPAEGPHNVADPEGFPIERRWADEHPDHFRPLYGAREGDPWFRLYRFIP